MNEEAYRAAEQRLWASLGMRPSERWLELPRHDTRIRVQEMGEGPPALFIASMSTNERSVRRLFRRLGQTKALANGRITQADIDAYLALLRHTDTMRNEIEPVRALVSPWHGLRRLELSDELLGRIRCPIRFIWGANDPFGDAEVARQLLPRLPTATLDLMPDAGHSPWLDDLDHCARAVESSLLDET